jgi:hypothetical protein
MAGEPTVPDGAVSEVDAAVHYRTDRGGSRIVVLPATCRRGLHDMATVGYRATESNGQLRIRCDACARATTERSAWMLRTADGLVNLAELDDTPYKALIGRFPNDG